MKARAFADAYSQGFATILRASDETVRPCAHRQAEPVVLSTGEAVACVCTTCLAPLSATWIDDQRRRAEITAYCAHEDLVDITGFGKVEREIICATCGAWNP